MTKTNPATVIIFPPSSGCELANWLLKLYEVPNNVICHTAPFFLFSIRMHGGTTYPFVEYQGKKLSGVRTIFKALEASADKKHKLLPEDKTAYDETIKIWEGDIIKHVDPAATRWAYANLLPHRPLVEGAITRNAPWWEKLTVFLAFPLIRSLIQYYLGITSTTIPETEKVIHEVFNTVDQLLADGRKFLAGDQLTIADISFATLAAPVVLEPCYGHGGLLPAVEDVPETMQTLVKEMRSRPAGKFIARIYQEYR